MIDLATGTTGALFQVIDEWQGKPLQTTPGERFSLIARLISIVAINQTTKPEFSKALLDRLKELLVSHHNWLEAAIYTLEDQSEDAQAIHKIAAELVWFYFNHPVNIYQRLIADPKLNKNQLISQSLAIHTLLDYLTVYPQKYATNLEWLLYLPDFPDYIMYLYSHMQVNREALTSSLLRVNLKLTFESQIVMASHILIDLMLATKFDDVEYLRSYNKSLLNMFKLSPIIAGYGLAPIHHYLLNYQGEPRLVWACQFTITNLIVNNWQSEVSFIETYFGQLCNLIALGVNHKILKVDYLFISELTKIIDMHIDTIVDLGIGVDFGAKILDTVTKLEYLRDIDLFNSISRLIEVNNRLLSAACAATVKL